MDPVQNKSARLFDYICHDRHRTCWSFNERVEHVAILFYDAYDLCTFGQLENLATYRTAN